MASNAARAYDYRASAPAVRRASRVGVVRGVPERQISPVAIRVAQLFMAGIVLFAVIGFARIGLSVATVSSMISEEEIAAQIDEVASDNASLSVQKSVLGSPSAVKDRATSLGMAQGSASESLTLSPDVVCYDAEGNLSLSASLATAA